MTKKHFRALAEKFYEHKPLEKAISYLLWVSMTNVVADVCAQANPNFDRERFLTACREGL